MIKSTVGVLLERQLVLEIMIDSALAAAGDSEGGLSPTLRLTRGIEDGVIWREWVVKNYGMVMVE
jgi:hypothetical protein